MVMGKTYIINTGCSYGVMFRSMKEFTKGNDSNFEVIDLHCDSFGSGYQKRSIIYTVSKLLSEGISPENILVIVEWSQPNRLFTEIPKELCKEILEHDDLEGTFILDNNFNLKEQSSKFIQKYKSLNVIFGDRVYTNPDVDDLTYFDNKDIEWYLSEYKKNCHISHKKIDRFENYLQNIVDTQSFLSSKNIEHISFLMNNTFTNYDSKSHIKDFSDYLTELWNQIDFSKFVFHNDFGGIDEFSMERFGNIAYLSGANTWDIPEDGNVMSFGAHPHDSVYINFFEEYIYDKVKKYFGKLTFNYSDRWSVDKHNAIRK
jgi:hypothetical protein